MRKVIPPLVMLSIVLWQWPVCASMQTRRTPVVVAVERAIPAVVDVRTTKEVRVSVSPFSLFRTPFDDLLFPRELRGLFEDTYAATSTSLGSGVIVDATGHIITNNHVVVFGPRGSQVADQIEVLLHGEDVTRQAQLVAREPSEDIAILRLIGNPPSRYLPFGASSDLMIGETVIAIGYALGQSHTVTQGIISQLGRFVEDGSGNTLGNLIQTDADINPGNSGGPLINLDGELIGINTAIATPSGGSVGIGFAIPVNRVRKIYNSHILGKPSLEERLGIQVQSLYPRWRVALREKVDGFRDVQELHGILVTGVKPGSPASGVIGTLDVIQAVNGHRIESSDDISTELVPEADTSVRLDTLREGKRRSVTVSLDQPKRVEWLGMELAVLESQWRSDWDVPRDVQGLVITAVGTRSPAQRAGLEPGDIIVQIGPIGPSRSGLPIRSLADLARARERLAGMARLKVYFHRSDERRAWFLRETEIIRG